MEEQICYLVESTDILNIYKSLPREELQIIRMFINLDLIWFKEELEQQPKYRMVTACLKYKYNFLSRILNCKYDVDRSKSTKEYTFKAGKDYEICDNCKCSKCIKYIIPNFINIINAYNKKAGCQLNYIDVVDYILQRKSPNFKETPNKIFFENFNIIDLIYAHAILEADLIKMTNHNKLSESAEFEYLDLSEKQDNNYFINDIIRFYRNDGCFKNIKINIKEIDTLLKIDDFNLRIYRLSAYFKYLIEVEKIDIIAALRKLLEMNNLKDGIKIRAYYYIHSYLQLVNELPCTNKTKEKITEVFNYILNYRYKDNVPFIPINIAIYTEDRFIAESITGLISNFMWFFGYLSDDMKTYNGFIDKILLDKFAIKQLYYNDEKKIDGIMLLHNIQNLLYIDEAQRNLLLNNLAIEMEKNNNRVCTIIYGNKKEIHKILENHKDLSQTLINIELDVDNMNEEKIYEMVIKDFEERSNVSKEIKEKLENYIESSYKQSEIKDMLYVTKLYNSIILQHNKKFEPNNNTMISIDSIPEPMRIEDIDTILKQLNSLVGLEKIKEQIQDLIHLLKFNKKANIDIDNFNLHMTFTGNPGTGKTTVARLITDILYNLGYIPQNKLTELTYKDLIADYIGQTPGKTYRAVRNALGGVLFIDEAYSITQGEGNVSEYGNECVATLLKLMEDYRDKLVIIFAGYKEEMDKFVKTNPGMASRIGYKIDFPDYTVEELTQIFLNLLEKNKLSITTDALEKIKKIINDSLKVENFGNARYINNMFQKILIEHAKNHELTNDESQLYIINEIDIDYEKLIAENTKRKIGF